MADPDRWFKPEHVAAWDDNPHRNNPTRQTQMEILCALVGASYQPGERIVDLGAGTGHLAEMILTSHTDALITLVDYSDEVLARARQRLAQFGARAEYFKADLTLLQADGLPHAGYSVVLSSQSLHHFPDAGKVEQLRQAHAMLKQDGVLLIQDRFAVHDDGFFPLYRALWHRQRTLFAEQANDESPADPDPQVGRAAELPWLLDTLSNIGFTCRVMHAHASRAVIAARKVK